MACSLAISFRFLDPRFHGRGDGGEPEWPPSPVRVFQALIAAAAAMQRGTFPSPEVQAALCWLECVCEASSPTIIAPSTLPQGSGYRVSVPNNALDLIGKAWSRGNYSMEGDANPATHRAMKTVRPIRFSDGGTVHFLFPLGDQITADSAGHVEVLRAIARNVVALGWGIDLVVGSATVLEERELAALAGERWLEGAGSRRRLRVPMRGTFEALQQRHRGVLERVHGAVWKSPPTFTRFKLVAYRGSQDTQERTWTAFALREAADSSRFQSFDAKRDTMIVAARLRYVTHQAAVSSKASEWSESEIAAFILGHGEARGNAHQAPGPRRFAYLPLPTVHVRNPIGKHVGDVRRVLVTTFADDCDPEVRWAERALAGQELIDERTNEAVALLEPISATDRVLDFFVSTASTWATVTPVVVPGFDDPGHIRRRLAKGVLASEQQRLVQQLEKRTDGLLRKAIVQAGIAKDLARNAVLSWQRPGFLSGVHHALHYRVPKHLARFPRLHVRIEWRDASGHPIGVRGPICIGGGRFYGMGLFAGLIREKGGGDALNP